jgi:hypothetical protein
MATVNKDFKIRMVWLLKVQQRQSMALTFLQRRPMIKITSLVLLAEQQHLTTHQTQL